ncbi:MAG: hypothetical protein DRP45_11795, partial [Candidatus Zixiibacteriota bacterium]
MNVTDEDNDTVDIYFWRNHTGNWISSGQKQCENCSDYVAWFNYTYTCPSDLGNWTFFFNATDENGNVVSTPVGWHNITRDSITINYGGDGNSSDVNRSDSRPGSSVLLSMQVWDSDLNNYTVNIGNETLSLWVKKNGNEWAEMNASNNGTHYLLSFNPDCNYTPGVRAWKFNVTNDQCWFDSESQEFEIRIWGDLNNTIQTPDGNTNYTKGVESVILRAHVEDEGVCGNNITNLISEGTIYFNLTNQETGKTYQCNTSNGLVEEGDGWYNCTWDTSGKDVGWYNVTFYTDKNYYNPDTASVNFYLSSAPLLEEPLVIPSSGGWNRTYNYTVNVTDEDNDTVSVYFYLNSTKTGGVWEYQETKQCTNCDDTKLTFNRSYSCTQADQSDLTTWFAYFNASDAHSNTANVSFIVNHTVEKDLVSIEHLGGNNSEVNRSDTVTLSTYVYDYDSGVNTTGPSVRLYVMLNSTHWDSGVDATPNQGYYSYDFNATCNYTPGIREWKMNITNDPCFKDNESEEFIVKIYGFLENNLTSPNGETYEAGENITLVGNVTDRDCYSEPIANASVRFIINSSSGTYYCPGETEWVTNTTNVYVCNWNSSGKLMGWYDVRMISRKDYYNNGTFTKTNAFYLTTIPVLKYANVTPRSEGWAIEKNFSVNVSDEGDNVTVWLWIRNSTGEWQQVGQPQECKNCSNQMLTWNKTFTYTDVGTWYFKFNATDTEGNNRTTLVASGDYINNDDTFIVEKDDVEFIHVYGNETTTTKTSSTWLRVLVNDTDRGGLVTNAWPSANIQVEVTQNDNNYLVEGSTTTNASGYANYEFLADCTYDPGKQKWRMVVAASDSYYKSSYSDVWNVTLDMQCPEFNVTQIYSPNEVFEQNPFVLNATIWIRGRDAEGTNASLQTPSWEVLPSEVRYLGTIHAGVGQENTTNVVWTVNATDLVPYEDSYKLNVTANTSAPTPQGYYEDDNYTTVIAYKLKEAGPLDSFPVNVTPGSRFITRFECPSGDYRIGTVKINWSGSESLARVYLYNSSEWVEVVHSYHLNTTEEKNVSVLRGQIAPNGTGYCLAKVENLGNSNITLNSLAFRAYYKPKVSVLDIIPEVDGNETNGMVFGEDEVFNVSLKIQNS